MKSTRSLFNLLSAAPGTKPLLVILLAWVLASCGSGNEPNAEGLPAPPPVEGQAATGNINKQEAAPAVEFPEPSAHANAELSFRIIDAPNGTYGYDILSNGRLFVHQTNLPGMPGVEGCRTKEEAGKLASFVIEKIMRGEMPPSVSPLELDSLGIR